MKKSLSIILATTMLFMGVLTGCSSKNDDAAQGTTDGKTGEQVTLNVWAMGEEGKILPQLAEEFTKENPDIKVNVLAMPWDQAHDKLLTAIASKKGPDVIQMGSSWIPEFGEAGAIADLAPYLEQYPELKQENFYPGAAEFATYDGKYLSAPWYVDTRFLYYRTDLLKEVGYDKAPETWEELSDAAQKLAARGEGKYGMSIDAKEQSLGFMFARQNGSEWFDANGKPLLNQPEFVEAVEYANSFFQNGSSPVDLGLDTIVAFKDEGIVPMFISGPWMIKMIQDQAPELEGKWATAVLPKKENNMSILGGSGLSIFEYSTQKDAAAKFIAYMSKPETQLKWFEMSRALPASTAAWENEVFTTDANYKVIREQLDNSAPVPVIKEWDEISQLYVKSFERIYRGKADVQKEMDEFNKQVEKVLSK
ncbi:sugar ABC transporter substrate-binding protein [Paenibacillus marinisediminis]